MPFSLQNAGFWFLAAAAFAFELLHLFLERHWPAVRSAQLNPGSPAVYFMVIEFLIVVAALAAGVGEVQRLVRLPRRPFGRVAVTLTACAALVFTFIFVLNI